jgi:diguanylate cyclase (GGDEF)-like protein
MVGWNGVRQASLPDAVRIELLSGLLSSLPQAIGISVTSTFGAIVLACRSGTTIDASFAIVLAAVGLYRIAVLLAYRGRPEPALTLASAVWWHRWQAGGLIAQAAILGMQSLYAFARGDTAAALLSLGFVMAFCAGACARLSVVPWIPISTNLLLLVPTICGALINPELPIKLTGVFLIAFIPVMAEATLYLYRLVVGRLLAQQEASHRASHDGLTGLPNRASFYGQLELALRQKEATGRDFAVLYLDLNGFKAVNDRMGHAAGDRVLLEVARRLRSTIGSDDLASRLGGDEFAILVVTERGHTAVTRFVDRIGAAIARPITTAVGAVEVGASIGVAHTSAQLAGADELLNAADQAMYAAKVAGGARWQSALPHGTYAQVA